MFSTFKQRLLLGIYIFIIISIPIGAYLASQTQIFKSKAYESNSTTITSTPNPTSETATSPAKVLLSVSESNLLSNSPSPSPEPSSSSPTIATSYGPTLSLKVALEGRPQDDESAKLFVGILEGSVAQNPKFLLSFTVDFPKSGQYDNISLAGLTPGNSYTAILKGPAQIATSSAFIMSPTVSKLNNGDPITLLTGDVNDDNVIDASDYSMEQKALGTTKGSANWNDNLDFNKDGVINALDLGYIIKNYGKTGATGSWYSPNPAKAGTASANLNSPSNSSAQGGYWMWVPK